MLMQSMTKYYIMAALSRQEIHGYQLITELGNITGKKPSAGQIYPILKELQKSGYITMKIYSNGKKKIKSYKMTKSGEKFFSEMTRRFASLLDAAIKAKVKICAHCGCEILKGAYSKNKLYFCCKPCAGSYKG